MSKGCSSPFVATQDPKTIIRSLLYMVENSVLLDGASTQDVWTVAKIALVNRQDIVLKDASVDLKKSFMTQLSPPFINAAMTGVDIDTVLADLHDLLKFAYPEANDSVLI